MKSSGVESAPARLVLDTSAYSHLRAGHGKVIDMIAAAEILFMPVIVLGELEAGYELGSRAQENVSTLAEFLAEPFVSILPITPSVARRYGQIFAQLRRAGTPITVNDIWIAAVAIDCAGHLLSFDQDFRHVQNLERTLLEAPT